MDKFCGKVLFYKDEEIADGVYVPRVTIRPYKGDIIKNQFGWNSNSNTPNDDLKPQHRISILQDGYLIQNASFIKAVQFMDVFWEVISIENVRPRLILTIGGVYNGSTDESP